MSCPWHCMEVEYEPIQKSCKWMWGRQPVFISLVSFIINSILVNKVNMYDVLLLWLLLLLRLLLLSFCVIGYGIQDLEHVRQEFYHWATHSAPSFIIHDAFIYFWNIRIYTIEYIMTSVFKNWLFRIN